MTKRTTSRSKQAREYLIKHPKTKPIAVAERFDMPVQSIYALRSALKKEAASWTPPKLVPMPEADKVDKTLDARAVEYGKFIEGAEVMQMIKRVVRNALDNRDKVLAHDQAEALDMIIHKMGRIINGNPDVVDHWLDIAGYAQLVADRLEGRIR